MHFCLLHLISALFWHQEVYTSPIIGKIVPAQAAMKYPYIVSLQMRQPSLSKTKSQHICGGSLLSSSWVLTAAHCVHKINTKALIVIVGERNLTAAEGNVKYEVKRVYFMNFQTNSLENDIALLKLRGSCYLPSFGKIPKFGMRANRHIACKVIGYGAANSTDPTASSILREAEVYVISKHLCRRRVGAIWAPSNTDNTICALGDKQDACQGDSGGPLLCAYQGEYLIYGIISHGVQCGINGMPGMYTVTVPFEKQITALLGN